MDPSHLQITTILHPGPTTSERGVAESVPRFSPHHPEGLPVSPAYVFVSSPMLSMLRAKFNRRRTELAVKRPTDRHADTISQMENPQSVSSEREETRVKTVTTTVSDRLPSKPLLTLLGGALLARGIWSQRRARAVLHVLAGVGLMTIGIWKHRSSADSADDEGVAVGDAGTVEERAESHQIDVNPRDVDETDTDTASDDESIQFTQGERPRSEPTLDDAVAEDPRLDDEADTTEVDLSEAAMADEASEAVGPAPEQSQPAQTESTEPEPSPPRETDASPPRNTDGESEREGQDDEEPTEEDQPTEFGDQPQEPESDDDPSKSDQADEAE